jgi:TolA-binding protein
MKFVKWGIFFAVAFVISFILLRTFSQEAFRQAAPARILGYRSPEIPIYYFIAGSFLIGLGIGLFIAIYNYITHTAENMKKSRKIKDMEKQLDTMNDKIAKLPHHTESRTLGRESLEDTQYRRDFLPQESDEEVDVQEDEKQDDDEQESSGASDNKEVDSYLG